MRVVRVEDLIIDRLKAAKSWKSERAAEQATVLFNGFKERIDLEYLKKKAREEKISDILPETARGGIR